MPGFPWLADHAVLGCALCGGTVDDFAMFLTSSAGFAGLAFATEVALRRVGGFLPLGEVFAGDSDSTTGPESHDETVAVTHGTGQNET